MASKIVRVFRRGDSTTAWASYSPEAGGWCGGGGGSGGGGEYLVQNALVVYSFGQLVHVAVFECFFLFSCL